MNLVDNPYALKSGEAQIATDVDIGLRDVLASRKGFTGAGLAGSISSQTKTPTAAANVAISEGLNWNTPTNALVSDNVRSRVEAKAPWHSNLLQATNCGFVLPAGAVPVGVVVKVERRKGAGDEKISDYRIQLVIGGVATGLDRAKEADYWTEPDTFVEYGGLEDLFGTAPTKTQVEAANFGAAIAAQCNAPVSSPAEHSAEIDSISITVYYIVEGFGADAAEHLRPWYFGAERQLVLSTNGKVKRLKAGAIATLFTGTAGTTWCFEQMEYNSGGFKDSLWMMNGTDEPKKWDGTTFANWGGKRPKGSMLRVWKNRMIVSGVAAFPQRVFFSEPGDPEKPEDETNGGYGNNWIDIRTSEDDLDPVTWLEVVDDVLLVFKKKSVNAIYDSTTFSFQRIANVGCEGRFQSCVLDNRAYFVHRSGVYSVTAQGALRYESLNIEPMFKGTGPLGLQAIDLDLLASSGRMCALPNGRVYLACTPKGSLANRWLLECYPRFRGEVEGDRTPWIKHSFAKRCIKSMCTYRTKDSDVDKVVSGFTDEAGASPELVYLFEGLKDGLEYLDWQWISGYKSLLSEEPFERIRRVDILMKGRVMIKTLTDGKEKTPSGFLKESTKEALVRVRPETRGRYHAIKIEDSGADPPTQSFIYKGELVLRGGKEH